MTPDQQKAWVKEQSDEDLDAINWWLADYARNAQVPPSGDWFVWFLRSGRGYGKTRTGSETVLHWVQQGFTRIALVGETKADVRDTMIEVGDSSITRVAPHHKIAVDYEPSKRRVLFPEYGAIGIVYSGDEPDQLRGPQHEKAWVDELAKFKYPEEAWSNLLFGLRIGEKPQVVCTTTPRPIKLIKELVEKPTTIDVRRNSYDNIDNLSPVYIREVLNPLHGTRLGRQEIQGQILDDTPGALWTLGMIEQHRKREAPRFSRVVVGVDPAGGATENGIIVAGKGIKDGHAYIVGDCSLKASPDKWGRTVVNAYYEHEADRVVAEVNFGGDMVEHVLRTVDPTVSFKAVRASRGKQIRAEPVAALYEQGKVHHVGTFPELEDELCSWVPDAGMPSPNRLDAAVWALSELMLTGREARVYAY